MKKFALITGASGGIGSACARKLASEEWNLYLHYHEGKENIVRLMNELKKYQIEMIPIKADLTTQSGIEQVLHSIFQLNAIVYSAGVAPYGLFMDLDEKIEDKMIQLNIKTPLHLVRELLPKLIKNQHSEIVFISSIWGQTGAACEVIYSTVKGAQISFVKSLSKEMARSGLRINCVAPGAVDTNMLDSFSENDLQNIKDDIPMGRLAMAKEVADSVNFLLSAQSTYITGQVLAVNGGWYT